MGRRRFGLRLGLDLELGPGFGDQLLRLCNRRLARTLFVFLGILANRGNLGLRFLSDFLDRRTGVGRCFFRLLLRHNRGNML